MSIYSPKSLGIVFCSLLALNGTLRAQEQAVEVTELKQLTDPTILKSRVWIDNEWNQYKHGAGFGKVTLASLWGMRVSENQDIGLRLKVPFAWSESGDAVGSNDHAGLGDIEFAAGTAFRLNKQWRTGGGLELHADSATDPSLGDQVWRLKPFWAMAYDAKDWLTLGFSAEYNASISQRSGVDPQNYLELFWPVTFILPDLWSVTAQYKGKVDFEAHDNWTQSVKFVVAKQLSGVPLNISAAIEKELDGGNKQFQVNLITTWFF